ncbi:MAG TPA: molybdopterin-dependent oxidoreductase, partial [Thermoleophilaceae bacterium]
MYASTRSYGKGAAILSVGIGATGLITFGYFALASHALDETDYGRISLLWSAIFIIVSVLYRPVEQLLSRTIADRDARGIAGREHLRVAATIQLALGLVFVVAALLLRGPLQDDLFGGSEALYWILIAAVLAYAASYFARGYLAGHHRFELYGGLVLMEATSRCLFALAVAVGIAEGLTAVALGMAAAPIVSLTVVPLALARGISSKAPAGDAALGAADATAPANASEGTNPIAAMDAAVVTSPSAGEPFADDAARAAALDAAARDEPTGKEPEFTLSHGGGFAIAVLLIMLCEQTFLNAGPLLVKATGGANAVAIAGFTFNVLLIARAPLQLFQAIQTSILPHLTRLAAGGESDPFKRSVNVTLIAIAGFAGCVALVMLIVGPFVMDVVFGDEFDYDRLGLVLVSIGMGLYLSAATLNQALLAHGRAKHATGAWAAAALGFVAFLLLIEFDDRVLQVELGYLGGAALLCTLLLTLYRRTEMTPQVVDSAPAPQEPQGMTVHYRTCPFCEATCGLELETDGDTVVSVRGDGEDVFSKGFICPKATGLKQLHEDPDRLTTPLIRRDGELVPVSFDEAFAEIDRRLSPLLAEHGRDAVAVYIGNPAAHNLSSLLYGPVFNKALGSRNVYSASSVDQMPKQVAVGLMFGQALSVPVPDVDRCEHLLVLGANPLVSNGSLLTAPDMRGRLRGIRERGGKVVVVDPRRTRTAELADEHHFIRPGRDAHLLLGIACTLVEEGLDRPGALADHVNDLEAVRELVREFPPERMAAACGIEADEIRRLARELAAAERAAVYARMGTTTQEYGTLASWLVDVLNVLTGNLDRAGGAMFPRAAAGQRNSAGASGQGRGVRLGRWSSRVRGFPESFGELPSACLAEEMQTPGEGRVRALVTIAGNPLVSTPNAGRLTEAVAGLDFRLAIDIYVNETTRHADVVLPAPEPLAKSHYDLALYQLAARNVANYSPALFEHDGPSEWELLLRLAGVVSGQGPDADVEALDDMVAGTLVAREVADQHSPVAGRDPAELLEALEPRRGPERLLDLMLRTGPYGDGFGADPDGLTLAQLEEAPHGIDLGPLQPRLPEVLRTPSGKIELAPGPI